MNQSYHRFTELFLQLGLPSDVDGIKHFLENHTLANFVQTRSKLHGKFL